MSESWKTREFECDGAMWTVERHVRKESNSESVKPTGLYFQSNGASRFLSFARTGLPSDADMRKMSDDSLQRLLRGAVPFR